MTERRVELDDGLVSWGEANRGELVPDGGANGSRSDRSIGAAIEAGVEGSDGW